MTANHETEYDYAERLSNIILHFRMSLKGTPFTLLLSIISSSLFSTHRKTTRHRTPYLPP